MHNATPPHRWPGRYGTVVVWETDEGHIATSSAFHSLLPSEANDPVSDTIYLARVLSGTLHPGNMVSETVAFTSDEHGIFSGADDVARVNTRESHEEVMREAGYAPAPVTDNLTWKDAPL